MTRALVGTGWMALICSLAYGQAVADSRTGSARLEFEVASVKPAPPTAPGGLIRFGGGGGPGSTDPSRVAYNNVTLRDLLMNAYGVKRNQIVGVPPWLDTERFDVTAKVPEGATSEQAQVMMQNLLAERFKVAVHHETQEMPMYALVIGKNGPKMEEVAPDAPVAVPSGPPESGPRAPGNAPGPMTFQLGKDGCPEPPAAAGDRPKSYIIFMNGRACIIASSESMSRLADQLSSRFDRPVVDRTGLSGNYEFRLRFDPTGVIQGVGPGIGRPPPPGAGCGTGPAEGAVRGPMAEVDAYPDVFSAVQEQLGLKLESRKGPVDLVVIDHAEKTPTEN